MSSVSRSRSALLGTISSQAYTIIGMLVSIISTPMMVKYLDKEAYGLSILFFQVIGYLSLFDFGFGPAVIQQFALHRGDDEYNQLMINRIMSTGTFIFVALGVVVALVGFFFAPFVPHIYELRPDLAVVAVPIVFTLSMVVGAQFLQRGLGGIFWAHHRQVLIGTASFFVNISAIFLTVLLLSRGVGLWSFVYANVFQVFTTLLVQVILLRRYYPKLRISPVYFDRALLRTLFGTGRYMFLHGLATQIILNTDRLVIGKVVSLAAVAVFSITVRIPEVGLSLLGRVTENATPAVMEIVAHESSDRAREQYRRVLLLTTALGAVAFWLILCFNKWFIALWVGTSFFAGNLVLVLALVLMMQQTVVRAMSFFLFAKSKSRQLGLMGVAEAAINIGLSVFLGQRIGLAGVLVGTLIASTLTSSWYTPYLLRRHLDIPLVDSWRAIVRPALAISVAGLLVYLLIMWLQAVLPQTIILFVGTGALAGILLAAYTWLLFLRQSFGIYIPVSLRPLLLVKNP